ASRGEGINPGPWSPAEVAELFGPGLPLGVGRRRKGSSDEHLPLGPGPEGTDRHPSCRNRALHAAATRLGVELVRPQLPVGTDPDDPGSVVDGDQMDTAVALCRTGGNGPTNRRNGAGGESVGPELAIESDEVDPA